MFHLLIDTCVWLDLAKDHKQQSLLSALEVLVPAQAISLLVPRLVVDEFSRNKARVIEESRQSLSGTFKRVKEAVEKFGDPKRKKSVLEQLNEVDHRLPTVGDTAAGTVARIEALFTDSSIIEISDAVKLRAAQRAIEGKAPFHRQKNSMNDSCLIELFGDVLRNNRAKGERFAFVTHNIKDFSRTDGDTRLPHPDIAADFTKIKSLYCTSLATLLNRIAPDLVTEMMIEQEIMQEPRRLSEILQALDLLLDQVWYNRHMCRREKVESGEIELVEKETFPVKDHSKRPIQRNIWEGALKAAATVEKKLGIENLGPWDDFEWGMVNGKLSALRWVLGEDWDMLDT